MGEVAFDSLAIKAVPGPDLDSALDKAKGVLLSGGAVAFPTESFYGLAVNIMDDVAIRRLFSIKGRQENQPILILIPDKTSLSKYVEEVPGTALKLMDMFWPGGLTLIFRAGAGISPLLTAGTGKIGIRLSGHEVASGLARTTGHPITGTSANKSGQPACVNAREVYDSIGAGLDLILDGGETKGGRGSTILDITTDPPQLIREGMISVKDIEMKTYSRPNLAVK
ncbi:MAG: threonylcarbamoyl-AMP synthase [Deltaproteobacteria bacterium]|nr:threonylcarbamoyl-AMP synthase [Deltaproteobacteria bacterium]